MMRLASWYDDADYYALRALRTSVVNDMNTRALTLQPVITQTYNSTVPSLVLAQMLYGDATREPDLVGRNDCENPGSMPLSIEALAQ